MTTTSGYTVTFFYDDNFKGLSQQSLNIQHSITNYSYHAIYFIPRTYKCKCLSFDYYNLPSLTGLYARQRITYTLIPKIMNSNSMQILKAYFTHIISGLTLIFWPPYVRIMLRITVMFCDETGFELLGVMCCMERPDLCIFSQLLIQ